MEDAEKANRSATSAATVYRGPEGPANLTRATRAQARNSNLCVKLC